MESIHLPEGAKTLFQCRETTVKLEGDSFTVSGSEHREWDQCGVAGIRLLLVTLFSLEVHCESLQSDKAVVKCQALCLCQLGCSSPVASRGHGSMCTDREELKGYSLNPGTITHICLVFKCKYCMFVCLCLSEREYECICESWIQRGEWMDGRLNASFSFPNSSIWPSFLNTGRIHQHR